MATRRYRDGPWLLDGYLAMLTRTKLAQKWSCAVLCMHARTHARTHASPHTCSLACTLAHDEICRMVKVSVGHDGAGVHTDAQHRLSYTCLRHLCILISLGHVNTHVSGTFLCTCLRHLCIHARVYTHVSTHILIHTCRYTRAYTCAYTYLSTHISI